PVTFTAMGTAGAAAAIAANSTTTQSGGVGTAVGAPPSVRVTDGLGNPVSGVSVTFTVTGGGGSTSPASPAVLTTGANGEATLTSWTLGTTAGTNTLTASSGSLSGSPVAFTATGSAVNATSIAAISTTSQSAPAGTAVGTPPSVLVTDAIGNPVSGVGVTFAVTGGGGSVTGGSATTNASGIATVGSWTLGAVAGPNTLTATSGTLSGSPVTFIATATAGAAAKLAFQVQPAGATAGATLTPAVEVVVQDAQGNTVTGSSASISVALTTASGATLTGGGAVSAVNGVATFAGLSVDKAASYTLTATSGGLATATSASFSITPAAASQLVFTAQPSDVVAGSVMVPPVQVTVRDGFGNTVATPITSISLTLSPNPGSISGTTTTSTAAGVATFSNLSVSTVGSGYTLTANGGGLQAVSAAFAVLVGTGNKLAFIVQPTNTSVGVAISPAVQVAVQDASGNLIPSATDSIRLSLTPPGFSPTAVVGVRAVNGIATFSNLKIANAGLGYTLSAGTPPGQPVLVGTTSIAFDVVASATTTTLTSDLPDPSVTGQPYTVNFTVASAGGTPTGTVTVSDGTDFCTGGLASGAGSCVLVSTTAGAKSLTATYAGDVNFAGSSSAGRAHTVNKGGTQTQITSDTPDPSVTGEVVTVVWSTAFTSGTGTLVGTVTVADGSGASCSAPVAALSCSLALPIAGNRTLTATYSGDANFNGSGDTEPH
ncbi:MAG: Ig-like domain repeat protein, partial [Gemmatimonadota bacterium]|nr:Ig-like domain repeat protein [Gemmatimonadota bacterium]